ncbi:MAG: transposase [Patescibacteria group bacterium]|nr:transposase [Patescibacteria group bacterium]
MPSIYLQRHFQPNTYHHIINRGCFKQKIFRKKKDYDTFIDILKYYLHYPNLSSLSRLSQLKLAKANKSKQIKKPYTLLAYCLMPNHFHLLLWQKESLPTLSNLLRKVTVTYAMYFQQQYQHSGALFQGRFKSIKVFNDHQLLYLTKYIHLNPLKTVGSVLTQYPYSSLAKDWLDSTTVLKKFYPKSLNPQQEYLSFIQNSKDHSQSQIILKDSTLE